MPEIPQEVLDYIQEIMERAQMGTSDYDMGVTDLCIHLLDEDSVEEFKFGGEDD